MPNVKEVLQSQCTGCGACAKACPNQSILMQYDKYGFTHPEVKDSCADCGLCLKKCHTVVDTKNEKAFSAYMVQTKAKETENKSASGGFCAELAKYFIDELGGVFYGCVINDDGSVVHTTIQSTSDIYRTQGSKYVQSNIENVFDSILESLKDGRYVLFVGTPCQVAALKSFLGKDYEKLVTVDIICHGVPSPKAFKDYYSYLNKNYNGGVLEYRFRNKTNYDRCGFTSLVRLKNGRIIRKSTNDDIFFNLFVKGKNYRESCYSCRYACPERCGEFTCGDCASRENYGKFMPYEAMSSVFVNTSKAQGLWDRIKEKFYYRQIDIDLEIKLNKQLHESAKRAQDRDYVCEMMIEGKWNELSEQYKSNTKKNYVRVVFNRIPVSVKKVIRQILCK